MLCYRLKKILFYPYVQIQRRRHRNVEHHDRMVLEVFNYSAQIFQFLKERTLLHNHKLDRNSIVVDVGGFNGEWANEIYRRYNSKMHVFEPNPNMLVHLNKAFSDAGNVKIYTYGLSDRDSSSTLLLRGPGSSIYKHPKVDIEKQRTADINLRDINKVFTELNLSHVDLIKINIEGGEYPLLYKMIDQRITDRCEQILVQFHEWYPWARWHRWNIGRKLSKTHKREWCYPFIWEKWIRKEGVSL